MRLYRETERWGRLLSLYETVLEPAGGRPASVDPDEAPLTSRGTAGPAGRRPPGLRGEAGLAHGGLPVVRPGLPAWPPTTSAVVGDLERLARDADEWPAYAELLTKRLDEPDASRQPERDERIDLLRRLLRVYVTRLRQGRGRPALPPSSILAAAARRRGGRAGAGAHPRGAQGVAGPGRRSGAGARRASTDRTKKTRAALPHRPRRGGRAGRSAGGGQAPCAGSCEQEPRNARALTALARVSEVTGDMATRGRDHPPADRRGPGRRSAGGAAAPRPAWKRPRSAIRTRPGAPTSRRWRRIRSRPRRWPASSGCSRPSRQTEGRAAREKREGQEGPSARRPPCSTWSPASSRITS